MPAGGASVRTARLAAEIMKIVASALEREYRSQLPGLVSLTSVELTSDLQQAKVYYSILGEPPDLPAAKRFFQRHSSMLRSRVARALSIRSVPELFFEYDSGPERAAHIERLLRQVREQRGEQ